MTVIYEPRGKAREYSPLALNLYKGCSHGCEYCYAPSATFVPRGTFIKPEPRKNILNLVEKDAQKIQGDPRSILLCFTCDPYQPIEKDLKLTRMALRTLNYYGLTAQVLTKGGMLAARDFDILKLNKNNAFSVTLTTDNPIESLKWEPGAALPTERISSLIKAHDMGIKTWVSFEPVINPEAVYRLIDQVKDFVDLIKVGKLNYHPHARTINWPEFREKVIRQLKGLGKDFYIKKDLLAAK